MSMAGLDLPWQCGVCKARFFRHNLLKLHNENFHNDTLDTINSGVKVIYVGDSTEETNENYAKNKTNERISHSGECAERSKENLNTTQHAQIADSTAQDTSVSEHTDPVIRRIIAKISHFKGIKPAEPRETPEFPCKRCDLVFTTKHERRLHQEAHARDLRFMCSECGRGFRKPVSLRAHARVHAQGRDHRCPHCTKMYRSQVYLKKHMKIHDPSKLKYDCMNCETKFPYKERCDHHTRPHSTEALHICELCGKRYRWRTSLKQHAMKCACTVRREDGPPAPPHARAHRRANLLPLPRLQAVVPQQHQQVQTLQYRLEPTDGELPQ